MKAFLRYSHLVSKNKRIYLWENIYKFCWDGSISTKYGLGLKWQVTKSHSHSFLRFWKYYKSLTGGREKIEWFLTNLVLFTNTNMHTKNLANLNSTLISRQKETETKYGRSPAVQSRSNVKHCILELKYPSF